MHLTIQAQWQGSVVVWLLYLRDIPRLAIFGCVCRSFALAAVAAYDNLETGIMQVSHDVHNSIAGSSKRQSRLDQINVLFQHLKNCDPAFAVSGQQPSIMSLYAVSKGTTNSITDEEWCSLPGSAIWEALSKLQAAEQKPASKDVPVSGRFLVICWQATVLYNSHFPSQLRRSHSSASAERHFSQLKLNKTSIRNQLSPENVANFMHCHC